MEELLTVDEVAKILKVHPKSVYRWVYERKLDACKVGKNVRFTEGQVAAFVAGKDISESS